MRVGVSQLFVLVVILLSMQGLYADTQGGVKSPSDLLIIQQIEGEKKILEAREKVLNAREAVLKSQEALVDEKKRNLEVEHKIFSDNKYQVLTFSIIAFLIGLVMGPMGFMFKAASWVKVRVGEEIDKNSQQLSEIADTNRLESRLKRDEKLLVLIGENGDSGLSGILRNFGFVSVQPKKCPSSPDEIELGGYTQVIFDNFHEEQLKPFVESGQVTWYFAYYDLDQYDRAFLRKHKIALANTRLTLYTRLRELLEWKDSQRDL